MNRSIDTRSANAPGIRLNVAVPGEVWVWLAHEGAKRSAESGDIITAEVLSAMLLTECFEAASNHSNVKAPTSDFTLEEIKLANKITDPDP